jgi:DNA (cytosine-5)-methyltransferase 1
MNVFPRFSTTKIGRNKDAPRVWLEGLYLLKAGFTPASRIQVHFSKQRVEITLAPEGARVVSSKARNDQPVPVLDLNSTALADSFGPIAVLQVLVEPGRIVLTPTQTERLRATRCRNGREGSCFSGGGLLSEAARRAGYDPTFAIEVNERYAEIFELNHAEAQMRNMSIEDVPFESLPPVELLSLGIPCEGHSVARRSDRNGKRDHNLPPEAHALSDLTVWSCLLIRALNPATVIIEQAPTYLTSAAGYMICHFLERAGYTVEAAVLDPRHYGELSGRRRTVIVAHTAENFTWPETSPCTKTVADILDRAEDVEHLYFTAADKEWLVKHWTTQTEKGNGFAAPQLTENATSVPALTKRYQAIRGDQPVLRHPSRDNTWRLFTISETMRLHGLEPESYKLDPKSKTLSGEILGQGVIVSFFEKIIKATRNHIPAGPRTSSTTRTRETESFQRHGTLNGQGSLAFA